MLAHISKIGNTTQEASFSATDSFVLLIHAMLMAARSLKNPRSDIFQSPQ